MSGSIDDPAAMSAGRSDLRRGADSAQPLSSTTKGPGATGASATPSAAAPPGMALCAHASAPAGWVGSVTANAVLAAGGELRLRFLASGETQRLRVPEFSAVQRGDRLWEHTCFEAFVAVAGETSYVELNFAPSGEWAAYRFANYREGMTAAPELRAQIAVQRGSEWIELAAQVGLGPLFPGASILRLGLSAVMEDSAGRLSYWALRHLSDRPDFHHPDCRALDLAVSNRPGTDILQE